MQNDDMNDITLNIFNKSYQIKCPSEDIQDLHMAAIYLDKKLTESSQQIQRQRSEAMIMAALNITHELLRERKQNKARIEMMAERIKTLQNDIQNNLTKQTEIDLLSPLEEVE